MQKNDLNKIEFTYEIGSNVITVDGVKKYVTIMLWDKDIKYEEIKKFICK